jgi:16S rRNA (guanine527-N7)-methyltransferase
MRSLSPEEISEILERMGFHLEKESLKKFSLYLRELLRWNRVHNLTSVTDPRKIVIRHFGESLILARTFQRLNINWRSKDIADVGSGAGFPGCPLKIYLKDFRLTLVESNHKKCSFLEHLAIILGEEWRVICKRAEEIEEKFDIVVTRALDELERKVGVLERLSREHLFIIKGETFNREWAREQGLKAIDGILWKRVSLPSR